MMQVIYAREPLPNTTTRSLFLAGPTPRSAATPSWRPEALELLRAMGFDGEVYVPEDSDSAPAFDYMDQVEWEDAALHRADVIVFWVPRELAAMPAFTTNVEWGAWCDSGKVVFGAPVDAPKNAYLRHYANKLGVPQADTLADTLGEAVAFLGAAAPREGGETFIPIQLWRQSGFQQWYKALCDAGHRLESAKVLWQFAPTGSSQPFCWVIQPRIYIPGEDRYKSGEFTVTRPDVAAVLAYHPGNTLLDTSVVLVREFRSNGATSDGFVHELPGGSSTDTEDPRRVAAEELSEETGLSFPSERFVAQDSRQCMATLLTHRCSLFSIELSKEELERFQAYEGHQFGANDSERTYIEVRTVRQLLATQDVDWSSLGMILGALAVG